MNDDSTNAFVKYEISTRGYVSVADSCLIKHLDESDILPVSINFSSSKYKV